MKRILKQLNLDPKKWNERTILGTISNAKNDLIDESSLCCPGGEICTPHDVRQVVMRLTKRNSVSSEAVDFDDLIMLTLRLFDQHPDVLTYYQQKFHTST